MNSKQKLISLLKNKESNQWTASKMNISLEELALMKLDLIEEYGSIKKAIEQHIPENIVETMSEEQYNNISQNINFYSNEPLSPEQVAVKFKINPATHKLSSLWNKEQSDGRFLVSANISALKENISFDSKRFEEFLSNYVFKSEIVEAPKHLIDFPGCSLILPKQDAHFNKYDIMGDNNIQDRFDRNITAMYSILTRASNNYNIDQIVYIVGSDQFNSEWTGLTTKGTPQQNILTYEGAFELVCQHEINSINLMLSMGKRISIVYVPGNHDRNAGWHLIKWLQTYYRNDERISFDTSSLSRKYISYKKNLVMLNHGDELKFSQLAGLFPMECKKQWSEHENFYVITGDKHHEKSVEINGIVCHQVTQLSNAKSNWDEPKGYVCGKAKMTGFILTEKDGMGDTIVSKI